ncbi:hypothetical protein [Myxococcus qinghaiensis]|uniref:hypothetical protein n=1 Tax=Myxococcus qinghaiensis TaxID=2906758 RepID=UPI0020A76B5D|nr:hypothetical protein [Myxococcus qinghaiensis]MCP3163319.1 hypothetical protein [Myxococcus qinghaiensis]
MTSTNKLKQQETEKRHIDEFLRRIGLNASVEMYCDAPDAVLLVDGRRVGLEHCELTEQELASTQANIRSFASTLLRELKKLDLPEHFTVGVQVDPTSPFYLKRSQVDELAERIAPFIFAQASLLSAGAIASINSVALSHHGFADIEFITIQQLPRGNPLGHPDVQAYPGHWGPGAASAQAAVKAKEQRLSAYKTAQSLNEVWLLLVTGESWIQATDSALTEGLKVTSTFDAVYLLDTRTNQLRRIDTRADE